AVEVTHGDNGWHPHVHVVVLLSCVPDIPETFALWAALDAVWHRGLIRQGWPGGRSPYRSRVGPVDTTGSGAGLAAYVAKVQDRGLGNEMARADLKRGREGNRTPFQILESLGKRLWPMSWTSGTSTSTP